jgi:naphtho-gamma-pyrone polyketide synthase
VLDDFLRFPQVADLKTAKVPIHAPYHASHFYSNSDVDAILKQSSSPILDETVSNLSIFSSTTGQTLPQGLSYRELLRLLLGEILLQPLNWDKVIEGVSSFLSDSSITRFRVVPVAAPVAQGLTSILRQKNIAEITIDDEVTVALHGPCHSTRPGRHDKSRIAIVGLSGRFPEAADPEHFWDLLYQGLDVHKEVPADRFDVNAHYDETGHRKNTSKVRHGCWINEPGLFDPRFFNISPKEAAQADPGQRLALQTAYEAIEMAGIIPDRTPSTQRDRVGIFYGMTSDDWREVNSGQNVDTYFIPGGNRAFTPGRINYYFKFSGPSVSADTACSSSLAAIHLGMCDSLSII